MTKRAKTLSSFKQDEVKRLKGTLIRGDGRIERHCEHGVGHTVGHMRGYLKAAWETIHGCCGCCENWLKQEVRDEK